MNDFSSQDKEDSDFEYISSRPSRYEQLRFSVYDTGNARFYRAAFERLGVEVGDYLRFAKKKGMGLEELYLQVFDGSKYDPDPYQAVEVRGEEGRRSFRARGIFESLGFDFKEGKTLTYQIHVRSPIEIGGHPAYKVTVVEG